MACDVAVPVGCVLKTRLDWNFDYERTSCFMTPTSVAPGRYNLRGTKVDQHPPHSVTLTIHF